MLDLLPSGLTVLAPQRQRESTLVEPDPAQHLWEPPAWLLRASRQPTGVHELHGEPSCPRSTPEGCQSLQVASVQPRMERQTRRAHPMSEGRLQEEETPSAPQRLSLVLPSRVLPSEHPARHVSCRVLRSALRPGRSWTPATTALKCCAGKKKKPERILCKFPLFSPEDWSPMSISANSSDNAPLTQANSYWCHALAGLPSSALLYICPNGGPGLSKLRSRCCPTHRSPRRFPPRRALAARLCPVLPACATPCTTGWATLRQYRSL